MSRTYDDLQLYRIITNELQKWSVYRLFLNALGGYIVFEGKSGKEFQLDGKLKDRDAYFRHSLVHDMEFDFSRGAGTFFNTLPDDLHPHYSSHGELGLDLFFDFIELIYPLAAEPRLDEATRRLRFDKREGQKKLRSILNPELALYEKSLQILSNGQIVEVSNKALVDLTEEALQLTEINNITTRTIRPIQNAVSVYIKRGVTIDEKKQAVRDLADSLESMRGSVHKHLLSADENELFQTANSFAIRHNTAKQKEDYDKNIWYDWMFHVNLAALLTVIKIVKSQKIDQGK